MEYTRGNPDFDFEKLSREAFEKAKEINYRSEMGQCLLNLGMAMFVMKNQSEQSLTP